MTTHRMPLLPVIVLDEESRGDLGLVRSLGIAGIPVQLATPKPNGFTAASRYVTSIHEMPAAEAGERARLDRLKEIAAGIGSRPPVMMAGDSTLELVSKHRAELLEFLRYDLPAQTVLETCFHKDRFALEATKLGLPTPVTHVADSAADIAGFAGGLSYPVFVKPFTKEGWGRLPGGVVETAKGQRVNTEGKLRDLFGRLAPFGADSALIQSFVPSPDSEHYSVHAYVFPDGRFAGGFTTRKLRVWPPHRGVGCMVVSEAIPELVRLSERVLAALSYTGFALLQYKRDMATGEFVLLEINCRYSTSGELPARCGANFPQLSHAVMTGLKVPELRQRIGPAWVDFDRDLAAMREYRQAREWTWPAFVGSLTRVRYPAYLAMDDFRPFLRVLRHRIRRRLSS